MVWKKPQKIVVLKFIFKRIRQTIKSIKKFFFFSSCFARMARTANMRSSGTRLEVSGVGKGEEMGVKEHWYVHRRLRSHGRGLWEHFPALIYFLIFYPISAYRELEKETTTLEKPKLNISFLKKCGACNTPPKVIRFVVHRKSIQSINYSNQNSC